MTEGEEEADAERSLAVPDELARCVVDGGDVVGALNGNFGALGYVIIAIFAFCWIISVAVYRMKRYDEIEVRIG